MTFERTLASQKKLDWLTVSEKHDLTSPEKFEERWNLLYRDTNEFYVVRNEYPYKWYKNHITIFYNSIIDPVMWIYIKDNYLSQWYSLYISKQKDMSVPTRKHLHLLKK